MNASKIAGFTRQSYNGINSMVRVGNSVQKLTKLYSGIPPSRAPTKLPITNAGQRITGTPNNIVRGTQMSRLKNKTRRSILQTLGSNNYGEQKAFNNQKTTNPSTAGSSPGTMQNRKVRKIFSSNQSPMAQDFRAANKKFNQIL